MALLLSSTQLQLSLRHVFPKATIHCLDRTYISLPESDLPAFGRELKRKLEWHNVERWSEPFDCDDHALSALHLSRLKHASYAPAGAQAPAFGMICYHRGGKEPHAANVVLCDGHSRNWHGWEPQTRSLVVFTPAEMLSAYLILI